MVTFIKSFKSELQTEAFEIQNMNHLSYLLLLNKERENDDGPAPRARFPHT